VHDKSMLSRRHLIGAGLGVAAGSIQPGLLQAAQGTADLGVNEIYARARGGIGGEPGMWWYSGRLWGKLINDKAVNFFAVEGFSFNRMERMANGGLRQIMEECGFWKDPQSGELLDDWTNPLNGLPCRVSHFRSRQDVSFSPDGKIIDAGPYEGRITKAVTSGNVLWISESLLGAFQANRKPDQDPLTYGGPMRSMMSLATFTSDADTVLANDPGFIPGTLHFQSSSSWYPWMRMGQAQGQISFELFGRKVQSLDEIPDGLRRILDDRRAGFLENPNL
jgi:hypothetical protein